MAFSPDGKILATGGREGLRKWNVRTGQPEGKPFAAAPGVTIRAVTFSPDGKMLAVGTNEGITQLWDVTELAGEVELLRKQLADTERELERLVIAEQVITQLTGDDTAGDGEPAGDGPTQRGFGLLVPSRSQASGPGDLPDDYRTLLDAVAAAAAETGGPVTCAPAVTRAGIEVAGRHSENVRAKLKRLEDRGWLRRTAAGKFAIAP